MAEEKTRDVAARVSQFLAGSEVDKDFAKDYMVLVLDQWRLINATIRALFRWQILLAVGFILIVGNSVQDVEVAGVKLSNLPTISAFVPPAIAALLLRYDLLEADRGVLRNVYFELVSQAFPSLHASQVDTVILDQGFVFGANASPIIEKPTQIKFIRAIGLAEFFVYLVVVPLAFATYAYVRLFTEHGVLQPVVWVSLGLTLLLDLITFTMIGFEIFSS